MIHLRDLGRGESNRVLLELQLEEHNVRPKVKKRVPLLECTNQMLTENREEVKMSKNATKGQ